MKIPFFGRLSRTFAILVSISCPALSWSVQSLPMPDNSSYFKVIDTRNGLSGNTISDIAEDCHGFLWIASWSGLTRFDGVRTKNFTPGTTAPHQLSNTVTRALETEPDGIWVATDNGIDFLNFATGAFEHGMAYSQEKPDSISRITTRISRIISNNRYTFALTIHGDLLRIRRNGFEPSGSKPPFLRINNEQGRKYADITPFTSGRIMAYSDRGIYILSENGEKELAHTPSLTVDILDAPQRLDPQRLTIVRRRIHGAMAAVMGLVIVVFYHLSEDDAISAVYTLASYTYGPILGLFAFGLLTRRKVRDSWVPAICIAAPALAWVVQWLLHRTWGYETGFELLIINAMLTMIGLTVAAAAARRQTPTAYAEKPV